MQATSIFEPVRESLSNVEYNLKDMAKQKFPFLSELLHHVFDSEGKRLRPAITLLAAGFHPHENKHPEIMATAVEMLHMATLIHDDTVDDSDVRRGRATVGSIWGPNAAVLIGDYIFAASATWVCDTGNVRVIRRFAETIMELSSGELQELTDTFNPDQVMDNYLMRIYNKTGSLFTTAGETGAILSGAPEQSVQALKDYGYSLGMAFQIVDDILDLEGDESQIGKPVGSDLLNGVLTLPSILAMQQHPADVRIREFFENPKDTALLNRSIEVIRNSTVIEQSYQKAAYYRDQALEKLVGLENNPSRQSLETLALYVLDRDH